MDTTILSEPPPIKKLEETQKEVTNKETQTEESGQKKVEAEKSDLSGSTQIVITDPKEDPEGTVTNATDTEDEPGIPSDLPPDCFPPKSKG